MAAPATNGNSCVEDTKAIIKNSFELAKEVDDLEYWIYLQRLTSATVEPNIQLKNKIEGNQSLCTIQEGAEKITCVIDYLNYYDNTTRVSPTKNNWCLTIPQTMYVETTYIYKCTQTNSNLILFYTVSDKPSCYSAVGTSSFSSTSPCYTGYDNDVILNIEKGVAKDLLLNDILQGSQQAKYEWGETGQWNKCDEIRFEVTDPILSAAVAAVATEDEETTTTLLPLSNETTFSPAPTLSPAPTFQPTILSCKDESLNIIQIKPTTTPTDTVSNNDIAIRLQEIQNEMMTGDYERHCTVKNRTVTVAPSSSPTVSPTNATTTTNSSGTVLEVDKLSSLSSLTADGGGFIQSITECVWNYEDLILSRNNKTTASIESAATAAGLQQPSKSSVATLCRNRNNYNGGIYVEDSVSITCTSTSSSSDNDNEIDTTSPIITQLIIQNKPSCRSDKCNADGVLEMATMEFQRWIRVVLNDGKIVDTIMNQVENNNNTTTKQILVGRQLCVIDESESENASSSGNEVGGVSVAVGGSTTGISSFSSSNNTTTTTSTDTDNNIFDHNMLLLGSSTNNTTNNTINNSTITTAVTITEEELCRLEFKEVNEGIIEIYNSKRKYMTYINSYTDLRQICGSPQPNALECNFDWKEIFSSSTTTTTSNSNSELKSDILYTDSDVKTFCRSNNGGNGNGIEYGIEHPFEYQYIESTFQISCTNVEGTLVMLNKNVPGCVSLWCHPTQTQVLLKEEFETIRTQFEQENERGYGWNCTTEVVSVFAPYYYGPDPALLVMYGTVTDTNINGVDDGSSNEDDNTVNDAAAAGNDDQEDTNGTNGYIRVVDGSIEDDKNVDDAAADGTNGDNDVNEILIDGDDDDDNNIMTDTDTDTTTKPPYTKPPNTQPTEQRNGIPYFGVLFEPVPSEAPTTSEESNSTLFTSSAATTTATTRVTTTTMMIRYHQYHHHPRMIVLLLPILLLLVI